MSKWFNSENKKMIVAAAQRHRESVKRLPFKCNSPRIRNLVKDMMQMAIDHAHHLDDIDRENEEMYADMRRHTESVRERIKTKIHGG